MINLNTQILRKVKLTRPTDREELRLWISIFLNLHMSDQPACPHHNVPLDYLEHVFFEHEGDSLVWACRGGGKTMIGAIATLLDLIFKPTIQVRILGGSLEQSEKMFGYLKDMFEKGFRELIKGTPTQRKLELKNGSKVEVLAQSERSVRGTRVQKLRCDEVELFSPQVWQGAQLTTKSLPKIRGSVEVFSTLHIPNGLMQSLLTSAKNANKKIFSWCIHDVLERCPAERSCETCSLWKDCQGRAKHAAGFLKIEDALTMKNRVSSSTWSHEMLCLQPRHQDAVFNAWNREIHIQNIDTQTLIPNHILQIATRNFLVEKLIAGVDFGFAGSFVCLWLAILREQSSAKTALYILDELVAREQTLVKNALAIKSKPIDISIIYCDIAGKQSNSQTGKGDEAVLRDLGFTVKSNWMRIDQGLELLREFADPAQGPNRLFVHPQCTHTIAAFEGYRRDKHNLAIKDGTHDHLIDALRYAACGHTGANQKIQTAMY